MKNIIILCFILLGGVLEASSLYSPYPATIFTNIELTHRSILLNKKSLDIYYYLSANSKFASYPFIAVPSLKLDNGLLFSLQQSDSRVSYNFSSGFGCLINPFMYKNNYYDMDCLLLITSKFFLSYRSIFLKNLEFEPFLGGDLDLFISTQHYSGLDLWLSANFGIKLIL